MYLILCNSQRGIKMKTRALLILSKTESLCFQQHPMAHGFGLNFGHLSSFLLHMHNFWFNFCAPNLSTSTYYLSIAMYNFVRQHVQSFHQNVWLLHLIFHKTEFCLSTLGISLYQQYQLLYFYFLMSSSFTADLCQGFIQTLPTGMDVGRECQKTHPYSVMKLNTSLINPLPLPFIYPCMFFQSWHRMLIEKDC